MWICTCLLSLFTCAYWSIPISHLFLWFTNTNHKFVITHRRFCPLGLKTRSKSQNLQFPSIRENTYTGFVIHDWRSQITNPGLYMRRNSFLFLKRLAMHLSCFDRLLLWRLHDPFLEQCQQSSTERLFMYVLLLPVPWMTCVVGRGTLTVLVQLEE